jgi:hypothetical protein
MYFKRKYLLFCFIAIETIFLSFGWWDMKKLKASQIEPSGEF